MATLQDIQKAHAHTPLGSDSIEFEIHTEWYERRLVRKINDRNLPVFTYSFISPRPRPREVFACDFDNRICDHYVDDDLRPMLEARMTDRTFNNRVGFGPDAAINQVIEDIYRVSKGFTRNAWIFKYDLTGYFPNADRLRAYDLISRVIIEDYNGDMERKDDLLYLTRQSLLSDPTARCEKRSRPEEWKDIPDSKSLFKKPAGIGGAIGRLPWQNTMNYYNDSIDHWAVDELGLAYTRYVDDTVIITDNKEAMLALLPEIRRRLALNGCQMHPHKVYIQHYTKGLEFLGRHIKLDRVYINNRIVYRAKSQIREFSHCIRPNKIDSFLSSINSYLGQCKNVNGHAIIMNLIDQIDPRWFQYIHYNPQRKCLQANAGYTFRERQDKKFNIKHSHHYDKTRKRTNAPSA